MSNPTMNYLIANWKSNETVSETKTWLDYFHEAAPIASTNLQTIVCMPFTNLAEANRQIATYNLPITVGAQDVSIYEAGAHTGSITARMLSELIKFCLVGHSERRREFFETSDQVSTKSKELLEFNITPIICVDTPYLEEQIKSLYQLRLSIDKCLFVYEPLSAIGTGSPATPDTVETVASKIMFLTDSVCPVLYGGSVSRENIKSFIDLPSISGVLVGSNSLDPSKFAGLMSLIS